MLKNFSSALALSIALSPSISLAEFPTIKEGYWLMESTDSDDKKINKTETCIDKNTMDQIMNRGQKMMGGSCTGLDLNKESSTKYSGTSVCNLGPMKITTSSTYEGDFSSSYTFKSTSKIEPAMMGNSGSTTTGTATYLGACPKDMKPGDIKTADGKIINPKEMMDQMPKDMMENLGNMLNKMPKQ